MRKMTPAEMDTVIASLRLWQDVQDGCTVLILPDGNPCGLDHYEDIATNCGQHRALGPDEVGLLLDEVFGVF